MKVVLVHDWLTGLRGGERCLAAFLALYPQADIATLLHISGKTYPAIDDRVRHTSFLQSLPWIEKSYRYFLPLYPRAVRGLDLREYDLVISLSHAAAKNVTLISPEAKHICYCFTPMRYIWDQVDEYFGLAAPVVWPMIRALRHWDVMGGAKVSEFASISEFVAARIRCFYRRKSAVIYPPVDLSWVPSPTSALPPGEAFLCAGALVPYKKVEVAVKAFTKLGLPLWVVGAGPQAELLRKISGTNVQFFGRVSDRELAEIYRHCRALIFPGVEDFGMIPVECLGAGRPVIGVYEGGLRETLPGTKVWEEEAQQRPNNSCGVFYKRGEDEVCSLIEAVKFFIAREESFDPILCRHQAERFGMKRFYADWAGLEAQVLQTHAQKGVGERLSSLPNLIEQRASNA